MPRVSSHTKSPRETKRPYRCTGCKREDSLIVPGDRYYKWAIKSSYGGTVYYRHVDCGRPTPTMLSHSKMAQVEEAVQDAESAIEGWTPELDDDGTYSGGYDDITSALEAVAEVAREVGEEYQAGFDAMPEGLQQGHVAQAMEEIAQELETWADDLGDFDPSADEPDLDPFDEDEEFEDEDALEDARQSWREAQETALEDWAEAVRSDAQDKLSEMPYYNG